MSQSSFTPIVVLFEDRPKQNTVFELNLSIYLDAKVINASSMNDLKKIFSSSEKAHLIVARSEFKGSPFLPKLMEELAGINAAVPVIGLGLSQDVPGVISVSDLEVKPMLQSAARILKITAKDMAFKKQPEVFLIRPEFLNLLFNFPCDVFDPDRGLERKIFSIGDSVNRGKIKTFVKQRKNLGIDPYKRLKLVNAITEQALKAAEDLLNNKVENKEKMSILAASLDMVSAQFQNAGMDDETVKLAEASIKAVEKIAESATNIGSLLREVMQSEGGYRYAHCQLVTFLGFHVIKMMGWWGDDQRSIISQAAFYHDISLTSDEQAQIRSEDDPDFTKFSNPAERETILCHPQLAARELQNGPDIPQEVIRVVIQHHGVSSGRGFSRDIGKFDNLSKAFILAEEWCDYLIKLDSSNQRADTEGKIRELKQIYSDEVCGQIIETFRYLDSEQFEMDFLSGKEVELAAAYAEELAAEKAAQEEGRSIDDADEGSSTKEASGWEAISPKSSSEEDASSKTLGKGALKKASGEEEASGKTLGKGALKKASSEEDASSKTLGKGALKKASGEEEASGKALGKGAFKKASGEEDASGKALGKGAFKKASGEEEASGKGMGKGALKKTSSEEEASGKDEGSGALSRNTSKDKNGSLTVKAETNAEENVRIGASINEEEERRIQGAPSLEDTERRVKGAKGEEELEEKISGVTDRLQDGSLKVRGGSKSEKGGKREARLVDVARTEGPEGDKARKLLEKIKEKKPHASPEDVEKLLAAGGVKITEAAKALVAREAAEAEPENIEKRLKGQSIEEGERHVKGAKGEEEFEEKISGVTDQLQDGSLKVRGGSNLDKGKKIEARLVDVARTDGPEGDKARKLLEKIKEKKPHASAEEVEKLLAVGGVKITEEAKALVAREAAEAEPKAVEKLSKGQAPKGESPAKGRSPGLSEGKIGKAQEKFPEAKQETKTLTTGANANTESEKVTLASGQPEEESAARIQSVTEKTALETHSVRANAPEEESSAKFESVTDHINLEKQKVSGVGAQLEEGEHFFSGDRKKEAAKSGVESASEKQEQKKSTISDVTEHIKDEVFLIKADEAKGLIDRNITRIKMDAEAHEKELKLKALAGSTEMMKAAIGGEIDRIQEILGASPHELKKTDAEGRTAIHYGAMGGHIAVLELLIQSGASLNTVDSKRRSPLFLAASHGKNEAFRFLLAQGAKINQQAMGGMTIAMVGAHSGNMEVLTAALENGVRPDIKDHKGKTALDYAKAANHSEIVSYLESLAAAKPASSKKTAA